MNEKRFLIIAVISFLLSTKIFSQNKLTNTFISPFEKIMREAVENGKWNIDRLKNDSIYYEKHLSEFSCELNGDTLNLIPLSITSDYEKVELIIESNNEGLIIIKLKEALERKRTKRKRKSKMNDSSNEIFLRMKLVEGN